MKRLSFLLALIPVIILSACTVEPQPIAYNETNCAHCQMTVTDKRYGAETVLKTGKAFFFDSAECMIAYLQEKPEENQKTSLRLVTDFANPGELVAAEKATFLQSEKLPSPMGMYLTAFASEEAAIEMQQKNGGRLMNWQEAQTAVEQNERPE